MDLTLCAANHPVSRGRQEVLRCAQLDVSFEKLREGHAKFTCKGYEESHVKAGRPPTLPEWRVL